MNRILKYNQGSLKKWSKRILFLLVGMYFFSGNVSATHIVGGNFTYTCLGDGKYEIVLTVRRDCEFGADDAPFDDPAAIAIYDLEGVPLRYLGLGGEYLLPFMGADTISNDMTTCFHVGTSVCVHEAVYRATIDLPFNSSGYLLAYQRCCRNETLNNIINPIETGATYYVDIPPTALETCNSSPDFAEWADIYICAGRDLVFDHSAIDADGDSLVYSICTPTTGATIDEPLPRPASSPPYGLVTHTNGFDNANLMGGTPLVIDPVTGVLTAKPELVGQYLIGVCVQEYRDGELLSTVRRDFEFNVRPCIDRPEIDFSINLEDCTAPNAFNISVSTADGDLAEGANPENNNWMVINASDTINGTGNPFVFSAGLDDSLDITLASTFANGCEITTTKSYNTFDITGEVPTFGFGVSNCGETDLDATFTADLDSIGDFAVTQYNWVFFMNNNSFTMEGKSVEIQVPIRYNLTVRLIQILENGCSISITEDVDFGDVPSLQIFSDPIYVCDGMNPQLVGNPNSSWIYTWAPETGLSFDDSNDKSNPTFVGDQSQTYKVFISSPLCTVEESLSVVVLSDIAIDVGGDISNCSSSGVLFVNNALPLTYEWAEDIEFSNPLGQGDTISYNLQGAEGMTFYVKAIAPNGCESETQSVEVTTTNEISIEFTDGGDGVVEVCQGVGGMIVLNPNENYEYTWSPMEGISGDLSNPKVNPTETTTYTVTVRDGICEATGQIQVIPGDHLEIDLIGVDEGGNVNTCASSATISAVGNCEPNYQWSLTDDFEQIISSTPYLNVIENGVYYVRAVLDNCESEVETIIVSLGDGPGIEFIDGKDGVFNVCAGIGGMIIKNPNPDWTYNWSPMAGISGDLSNPKVNPDETTVYTVTVSDGTCEATATFEVVPGDRLDIDILGKEDGRIETCGGSVVLTVAGNCEPNYEWSLSELFETTIGTGATLNVTESGTYFVRAVIDGNCMSNVARADVTIGDGPSIEFTDGGDGVVEVCQGIGGRVIANPNPGWTYTWSPMEGISGDFSNPKVNPTEETTYTVTVSDGSCDITGMITVSPGDRLEIEVSGKDESGNIETCAGTALLEVFGNCEPNYQWSKNPDFNNIISTQEFLNVGESGTYYVRAVIDGNCESEVEEVNVILGDGPSIDLTDDGDGSIEVCEGVGSMIIMNPNPDWSYTWSPEDGISGDLSNPKVNPTETTTYIITVSDGACSTTAKIEIVPGGNLEIDIIGKDDDGIVSSCSGTVDLMVRGNCEPNYEWSANTSFNEILGTGEILTVSSNGIYYVRALVGDGCQSEIEQVEVSIGSADLSIEFTGQDGVTEVCEGIGSQIVTNPNPEWTYTWSPMDGISGDLSNPIVNPTETTIYTVTVMDGACEITSQIEVRPSNMMTVTIEGADENNTISICASEVILSAIGNSEGTYEWSDGSAFRNILSTDATLTVTTPGRYYVRAIMSTDCESNTTAVDVILNEGDVSIEFVNEGPVEVCEGVGGMIVANPNPEWTYTWSPMDGISGDLSNPKINPTENTSYTVTVTDGVCEQTATVEVVLGGEMQIMVSNLDADGNVDVCGGSTMVMVSGNCEPNYEWSQSSDFSDILSTQDFLNITDVGTYYVRAITGSDACNSEVVEFNAILGDGPNIEFTDGGDGIVEVCEGIGAMIIANPNPDWTYTWSPMEGISGELSNPKVNPSTSTTYTVTVSDGTCETTAMVIVEPGNTMDISVTGLDADGNVDVCGGTALVTATGNCEPNYEWSNTSDFSTILSTKDFYNVSEEGAYFVRAITGSETCESNVVMFNAILGDGPTIEFTDGGDGTAEVCMGVGGMIVSNPNPEWTYTWSPMDGISGELSNPKVNPDEATTYTVTVSDGTCESTAMIEVVPGDSLEIAVQGADRDGNVLVCNGETVTLKVTGNCEPNYEWSINESFDPIISTTDELSTQVTLGDTYFVRAVVDGCNSEVEQITLSDISGEFELPEGMMICPGDTLTFSLVAVNGAEDISITWAEDPHIISRLDTSEITIVHIEGDENIVLNYTKTTTDGSCEAMSSVMIPMGSPLEGGALDFERMCGTFTVCFTSGLIDGAGSWDFGVDSIDTDISTEANPCFTYTGPGEYNVMVSVDSVACGLSEMNLAVLLTEIIEISTPTDTVFFCEGDDMAISASSALPENIVWISEVGDTLGTGPTITVNPASDTTIFALASDGLTCVDTAVVFLDGYFFDVEINNPDGACPGEMITLSAVNNSTDSLTYLWGPEEIIVSGGDTPTPVISMGENGDVFLTVTNVENGCTKEFTIPVIMGMLDLTLSADPGTDINRGQTVEITATAEGEGLTYAWSNGDTTETIVVSPDETTTFNVQVTDGSGCSADGMITINVRQAVCDDTDVFLPTAFSPNGDGVNDEFLLRSNFIQEMELDVYDRWGENIFSTLDQRTGWNGTFEGKELAPDVYAYRVRAVCTNDVEYTKIGNVTLVR